MTLTGTLGSDVKLSIADGATVTLSGATIPGRNTSNNSTSWAGLICLDDATIVLADGTENSVKGYHANYPGIQAGPKGTTLTIRGGSAGTGKLTAHCGMDTFLGYGAGIGGGYNMSVGNIRIEGGNISISGTATGWVQGGTESPFDIGKGHGENASCGTVSVTANTISGLWKTAPCEFSVSLLGGIGITTCATITINDGTKDYVISNPTFTGSQNIRTVQLEVYLPAPRTNVTLTVTATGGDLGSNIYRGSISGVTISEGVTNNLGTVVLNKQ